MITVVYCGEVKNHVIGPVHNTMQRPALRCVAFVLALITTQGNARIDLDPILASLCIVWSRKIVKF